MKRWKHHWLLLICGAILGITVPGWGESPADSIKAKISQALVTTNFTGELTMASFRFARRQEMTLQIWAKDRTMVQQYQSPSWQRGEVIIENDKEYYYIIPSLSAGLKRSKSNSREFRDWLWRSSLNNVNRVEDGSPILGRDTYLLSGEGKDGEFKIWVAKDCSLPLAFELYKNNLMVRSIRFSQFDLDVQKFNPMKLIPAGIKWYNNDGQFWQAVSIPRIQPAVSFTILEPIYLPPGYKFKRATIEELSIATVVYLVYENSDHQVITIFERQKLSEQQKFNFETKEFQDKIKGNSYYQWFEKQVHAAIFGPVTPEELRKIAASTH